MLTFPELRPEDFRPWIDEDEAARAGKTPEASAAGPPRRGAKDSPSGVRTARASHAFARLRGDDLHARQHGRAESQPAPLARRARRGGARDAEAMRERASSAVSGLLALLGDRRRPAPQPRAHPAGDAARARLAGRARRRSGGAHPRHPVAAHRSRSGVLDLESFFPAKDRFALAMQFNNLLARRLRGLARGRAARHREAALHPGRASRGCRSSRSRTSSDAERMFFVTLLLNELIAWMRTQPGTSSLRAIALHGRDLRLLPAERRTRRRRRRCSRCSKQARAFGLGVRARHAEPGRPRLQGARQRRHVVHRPPADRARQGARARRTGRSVGRGRPCLRSARRWTPSSRDWATACSS